MQGTISAPLLIEIWILPDIQKNSKQAIFSLHRGDVDQAASRLSEAGDACALMACLEFLS